ncbi:putative guanine deaminase, partial [Obelidium mucronatum]
MLSQRTKFVGPLIQCFNSDVKRELEIFELVCIEVDRDGVIVDVSPGDTVSESSDTNTVHLARGQFFIPGFIDLHFHAPQFPQAGTKMSVPLSEWLATTTLPLEAKYADPIFAQTVFDRVVAQTLKHGTTTAVYFATKHQKAALTLAQCCMDKGQRALVGKVCMDNKEMCMCISNCLCTEETSESIQETRVFLESMVSLTTASNGRVKPVVTPRFVPSCSPQLLDSLGELTQEFKVHVQSHAWESDWQVDYGLQNRDGGRDLGLFRNHGLISEEGTILAHAVHATEDEIVELAKSKIGIAHCPLSNAFFA